MAPGRKNLRVKRTSGDTLPDGRRSSLQVNLSYISNLSDSGNGSLRSQAENLEATARRGIVDRSKALSDIVENAAAVALDAQEKALSAMRSREQELNQSCQLLKDAILQKTREMFDQKADLAVRTTSVLKAQRSALKEINDDSRSGRLPGISVQSSASSKIASATKIGKSSRKSIEDPVARVSRGGDTSSIILSGSCKSHRKILSRITDKVPRVILTKLADPRLEMSMESLESSQSSLERVFEDIGAPVTCSSFISGYGKSGSQASQRAESKDRDFQETPDEEKAGPSVENLTPMEIGTAVQLPVPSSKKSAAAGLRRLSGNISTRFERTSCCSVKEIPMELTTVQSHIPFGNSAGGEDTARTSLNVNTSANEASMGEKNAKDVSSRRGDSATQLSLRVNTSVVTQERSPAQETVNSNAEKSRTSVMENSRKNANESKGIDPMENMSLTARLRNISGLKATEDKRKSRSSLGEEGASFVEGTPYPPSRSILWRTQIKSATFNTMRNRTARKKVVVPPVQKSSSKSSKSSDSDSSESNEYLTPPNTIVVLDDSPCRFTANSGNTQIIPDSSDGEEATDVPPPTTGARMCCEEPDKPRECAKDLPKELPESIPMDFSSGPSNDSSTQVSKELSNGPSTPKEIPNDHPSINPTGNISRPGKRKLLPLQDPHQLFSFSPASPALPSPKPIKRRRIQKRRAVRAVAAKRIESLHEEDEDEGEPAYSRIKRILTAKDKDKSQKTRKPRKIISKKIVVKKIVDAEMMDELKALRCADSDRDSTTAARSSLNEFSKQKTMPISGRKTKSRKLVIVATGFSKGDVDLVKSIAKELGGAEISSSVSRRTTHVVSTGVRTINLLRGIIRGCWLVSLDWVMKSLEKQKWLDAEEYEMVHFSKAVQENRRDRQVFGKAYVPELFTTCGPIYIQHGTNPPPEILKELVKTAGGRITENLRDAKLSVGPDSLREIWILDSITTGDLQPIEDYKKK